MDIEDIQSIEELYNYYQQNTDTITKEDAEKLLAKSLRLEIHEWNDSAHKHQSSKEKIILQENLITPV